MKKLDNTQKEFIRMILNHDSLNCEYEPFLKAMSKIDYIPIGMCGNYFKSGFPHSKKTNRELLNILRKGWVPEWKTYLKEKCNEI